MTRFFQTKIVPPGLWNASDYFLQFTFVLAHILSAQNTAADYLTWLESDPKGKLVMKIRKDVQTLPIETIVQSAGVSQEDQIFHTNDGEKLKNNIGREKKEPEDITPLQKQP